MNTTLRRVKRGTLAAAFVATALMVMAMTPASAQDLSLPADATLTRQFNKDPGAYDLPIGAWTADSGLPTQRVEGAISTQSWRIDASGLTPLQLIAPLRAQLIEAGYDIVLDCMAQACGGFDYRFSTLVMPAPQMFVDLTEFHALSALGPSGSAVSLLASRDATSAYLQIIRAGAVANKAEVIADAPSLASTNIDGIAARLETDGHAILRDMVFETGSSALSEDNVPSLDQIATYLQANPSRRILFVGHTDAVGSLENNQALSQKRAQSAVDYLRQRHDIPAGQIGANGAGYLSPVASNLTPEGREVNRRVEAVLISTQ